MFIQLELFYIECRLPFDKERKSIGLFDNKEWNGSTAAVRELLTTMLYKDPSKRPTTKKILEDPWVRRIVPLLEVTDAKSDSDSVISFNSSLSHPTPKRPVTMGNYGSPVISSWTFSDILGLGNSISDSTDDLSPEDLNTKSSASNYTSPRTPKKSTNAPSVAPTPEKSGNDWVVSSIPEEEEGGLKLKIEEKKKVQAKKMWDIQRQELKNL